LSEMRKVLAHERREGLSFWDLTSSNGHVLEWRFGRELWSRFEMP
jgi:hypothetical protein